MGKIKVMDDRLANQIAAGEVVERPASVVKELVENALDSQAERITISIEEGGIRSIRVTDDGSGMDREDAVLAFERHATSKIRRERDLFSIRSLGFRGEALPSIASVSRLTLTTSEEGGEPGTRLVLEGGKLVSTEDAVRSSGTEVIVEDLFFNTPARLKYLKTVNTEISHVADVVGRLALAHPDVSFLLTHNDRKLFRTPGDGKMLHVVHALYGKQVAQKVLPFAAEDMDFTLEGLVVKPEVTRSNRSYISTVINGRYIRNIPLTQAILRAYDTLLPIGRYPIVVLSIMMDPKLVDVNVHPSKLEVRLSKEKALCRLIENGIKDLFRKQTLIPEAAYPRQERSPVQVRPVQERLNWNESGSKSEGNIPKPKVKQGEEILHVRESGVDDPVKSSVEDPALAQPAHRELPRVEPSPSPLNQETPQSEKKQDIKEKRLPDLLPLAQIHGTYIIAQSEDGFYILDQHAAHERIYYEIFYNRMKEQDGKQQPLLVPMTVECTPSESEAIRNWIPHLTGLGMDIEPFGGTTFLVRSHPAWFPQGDEEALIREILDWVKRGEKMDLARLRDDGAKMMSCKAAIKANRHLRKDEMESLIRQLKECETPFTCPHGRPIFIRFSTYEIEKMFKRVM
ncbi:DNA mismatch repair endonuclease MutL [Melghirimyces algeriensis]|uniref:DNA mismatch repair protein MutL n=1 Tax=Melghirimyces algeriensis TaxID=910412 RepID=A0A521C9G4_9BACL|nr:DNA mismatch repair endonuclease MutL [Melghirimyces algeriensis]SMO56127.1 DNA mismatch repair protein MutL [Melghirimyces algeriensis]